jgi:hypothetical protein
MTPEPGATYIVLNIQTHVACGQTAVATVATTLSGTQDEVSGEVPVCAMHRDMFARAQFLGTYGEDIAN